MDIPTRAAGAPRVQAKPTVSQPGDPLEREADRVADEVMRMPDRGGPPGRGQPRLLAATQTSPTSPVASLGAGSPLSPAVRAYFEPRFGRDFGHVRIHDHAAAARSAAAFDARAYTVGRDMVFGDRQYRPDTGWGRRLLAHELAHVAQQDSSPTRTIQRTSLRTYRPSDPFRIREVDIAATNEFKSYMGAYWKKQLNLSRDEAILACRLILASINAGQAVNWQKQARAFALQARAQIISAPSTSTNSTELSMLGVGNFDFSFKGCAIGISVRLKFQFEDGITAAQRAAYRARFFTAVNHVWANSGWSLRGAGTCRCSHVPIRVAIREVSGGNYHKLVDVEANRSRESVIIDINVGLNTTNQTIAHEFGHVLGLYDEYDGGFFENIMWWHQNTTDWVALMNSGAELRPRYFEHFRRTAQSSSGTGCNYVISSPLPPFR